MRRDPTVVASVAVLAFFVLVAILADVLAGWYGVGPDDAFPQLLDPYGYPLGLNGGISADHWFGLEPGVGRDVLVQLVYGTRTSLGIAVVGALFATVVGVLVGLVAGYFGGWVDAVVGWVVDVFLAFPFVIFALAAVPVINTMVTGSPQLSPGVWVRIGTLLVVLVGFGWMSVARIVRGQVLSLRTRPFVEAAHALGAGPWHVMVRHLLPQLWGPVLVGFTTALPTYIQAEAALSFLTIGVVEPVPDWGRMIYGSIDYLRTDWTYPFFPGVALVLLVLATNLLGDAVRDRLERS